MLFQILLSRCLRLNFFVFPTTNCLDQAVDRSSVIGAEGFGLRGALVFEHRLDLVAQLGRTLVPVG
jgi:hypothetical protein